ncbi:hypothetical protein CLOM_g12771 [Closterium sp. NIES-68]|nr:hypothetical protein CLOM_g12771 [Closterium sp. NIES-68]GJP66674.1 hypothetical protein CLOP_g23584 [Closterium sp. NIES-67]
MILLAVLSGIAFPLSLLPVTATSTPQSIQPASRPAPSICLAVDGVSAADLTRDWEGSGDFSEAGKQQQREKWLRQQEFLKTLVSSGAAAGCPKNDTSSGSGSTSTRGASGSDSASQSVAHGLNETTTFGDVGDQWWCSGDEFNEFISYLVAHGAKELSGPSRKVQVTWGEDSGERGEEERGIRAARDLDRGEVIATVHYSSALVQGEDDPLPYPGAPWTVHLAAKLLREYSKGSAGKAWPYLRCLPRWAGLPWLGLREGADWESEIQHAGTVGRMREMLEEARMQWQMCRQEEQEREKERTEKPDLGAAAAGDAGGVGEGECQWEGGIAHATWPEFAWALTMVFTHAYSLPRLDGTDFLMRMFLPVADLLNHDPRKANVDWYSAGLHEDRLELVALNPIMQGDALVADYGQYSSDHFLLTYGFVPGDNVADRADVFQDMTQAVAWYLERYYQTRSGTMHSFPPTDDEFQEYVQVALEGAEVEHDRVAPDESGKGDKDAHGEGKEGGEEGEGDEEADDAAGAAGHDTPLYVYRDARVDARLLGAFAAVQRWLEGVDWEDTEEEWVMDVDNALVAVGRRCRELLDGFPTSLARDRGVLWQHLRCSQQQQQQIRQGEGVQGTSGGERSVQGEEGGSDKGVDASPSCSTAPSSSSSSASSSHISSSMSCSAEDSAAWRGECDPSRLLSPIQAVAVRFRISVKEMLEAVADSAPKAFEERQRVRPALEGEEEGAAEA